MPSADTICSGENAPPAASAVNQVEDGPVQRGRIYFKLTGLLEFIELVSDIDLPVIFLKGKNRLILERKEQMYDE